MQCNKCFNNFKNKKSLSNHTRNGCSYTTIKAKCLICKNGIPKRSKAKFYCGLACNYKSKIGVAFTPEHKKRISESKFNENNPQWKGDNVGYHALHYWIKSRLPKTSLCQSCNKIPPKDLANKGIYDRNINNWEWLCRRCHMTKDGRLKNLINQK